MKKKALGRGLDALLKGDSEGVTLRRIPLNLIEPNPFQPRSEIPEKELEELASTVKEKGILQPIIVREVNGRYQLVSGERRWRAAQKAGLKEIPAVVKNFTDREMLEVALIENVQRQDLSPLDEAIAYERLIREFGYTQEEVAKKVGKSRSAVANTLRLLRLPAQVKKALKEGKISEGHARALLSLGSDKLILKELKKLLKEKKSVREVERAKPRKRDPNIEALEKKLYRHTGLKVRVTYKRGRGKVVFQYSSLEDLERLLDLLGISADLE